MLFRTVCEGKPIYFEDEDRSVSLADAAKERKPKVLVITLGVSGGAGFMPEEKFVAAYEKMIDTVTGNSPRRYSFSLYCRFPISRPFITKSYQSKPSARRTNG
mgnify:CR=1 FL=1